MLIPLSDILILYEKIITELNISYMSVLIFTSLDADSVCTLKILSRLLQSDNIMYKVYPVSSYTQLHSRIQQSKIFEKVKLFFFINCGGILDLSEKWFSQTAQIFLFDVNKPIHHKNIEHLRIKVIDDGHGDLQNFPTTQQCLKYDQLQQYQLDQQNIDQLQSNQQQNSPKRKDRMSMIKKVTKHKQNLFKKINNYYGKQTFSLPSSYIAYRLVRDLNKINNDFLWYGIVGLISMFMEQRLSKEIFENINSIYRSDTVKLNPQIQKKQKGAIAVKLDYQFTLLRHWSLYDSIMNSPYMLTKLALWDQKGRRKLNQLLALLEISLAEAKQLYKYMPKNSKQKLKNNIFVYAQKFNLHDVAFHSFAKQIDFSASFMASDFYYAITNTLEKPQQSNVQLQELHDHRATNFWQAYEIFESTQNQLITKIQQSKKIISLLTQQAIHLIQRDHVILCTSFYFVNIRNDTKERKLLEHPYTLIRLAYLLMGVQQEKKKSKTKKPFIASLQDTDEGNCTVVGVMGQYRNSFGAKFLQVSSKLQINVKHDSFMANIMTIPKELSKH